MSEDKYTNLSGEELYKEAIKIFKNSKEESIKLLKMAVDKECPEAIMKYSTMLYKGNNIVKQDKEKALEYSKLLSIEYEDSEAMYKVAWIYKNDEDMKNIKEARFFYDLAASEEHPRAMYDYSLMLKNGDGVSKNEESSLKLLKKSVEKEYPEAVFTYAIMLYKGDGIQQDKEKALEYLKKLEKSKIPEASYNIGAILENDAKGGRHINISKLYEAEQHFLRAKELGYEKAEEALDSLYNGIGNNVNESISINI